MGIRNDPAKGKLIPTMDIPIMEATGPMAAKITM